MGKRSKDEVEKKNDDNGDGGDELKKKKHYLVAPFLSRFVQKKLL